MRIAYADPPYLGQAKLYPEHPDAHVYDEAEAHGRLMERMDSDYDGWALSLSSSSLREILPLAPEGARVAAWVKGWCSWKPGISPAYAWEPLIFRTARALDDGTKARDWVMCNVGRRGFIGAKPIEFCDWLFNLLGAEPDDDFADIFPGSGGVTAAWEAFSARPRLTDRRRPKIKGDELELAEASVSTNEQDASG